MAAAGPRCQAAMSMQRLRPQACPKPTCRNGVRSIGLAQGWLAAARTAKRLPEQDSSYLQGGAPLVLQDVQAYPPQLVDVGVVDLRKESHLQEGVTGHLLLLDLLASENKTCRSQQPVLLLLAARACGERSCRGWQGGAVSLAVLPGQASIDPFHLTSGQAVDAGCWDQPMLSALKRSRLVLPGKASAFAL